MKRFIKILPLLLLPVFISAQSRQKQLDSLHLAMNKAANDSIRMEADFQLGLFYLEINFDSSLFYLNQTISIAQKLKFKLNEANALQLKGYMLMKLGNYPKSLESFLDALKIAEAPVSEKNIWYWDSWKGRTPRNVRLDALGFVYHNMGHLYGATGNTDEQISNYLKAKGLAEFVQDTLLLGLANMNLGSVYLSLNKLDSALGFEQRALDLFSNLAFKLRTYDGNVLNEMGNIYRQKGNLNLAVDAYIKSVKLNTEHNNLTSLTYSLISLGSLYQTLNKTDSGLFYAWKALETAKTVEEPWGMANAYQFLSKVYSDQKYKDSAYVFLKLSSALRDSMNTVERENQLAYQNVGFDEQLRLKKLEEEKIQTQNKIRTYTMLAGLGVFLAVGLILYRNNRQKRKANEVLEKTLNNLKATQSQLIQSEKMASLGELTAGIAHEIQNPLNFVNNFSEVNSELITEMKQEIGKGNFEEVNSIANNIDENEQKIIFHGKRADAIVKGMLQHSRNNSGLKEPTDINALADEYLRLSYHGLRAKDKSFNATMKTDFDESIGTINIIPQDIGRVILNLINNAFYAATQNPPLGGRGAKHESTIWVSTKKIGDKIFISVRDNGPGIPKKILDKIFQPFFTTKPTGLGTGLGLSLSYDIVKAHGGEIKIETKEGEGSKFVIMLPII